MTASSPAPARITRSASAGNLRPTAPIVTTRSPVRASTSTRISSAPPVPLMMTRLPSTMTCPARTAHSPDPGGALALLGHGGTGARPEPPAQTMPRRRRARRAVPRRPPGSREPPPPRRQRVLLSAASVGPDGFGRGIRCGHRTRRTKTRRDGLVRRAGRWPRRQAFRRSDWPQWTTQPARRPSPSDAIGSACRLAAPAGAASLAAAPVDSSAMFTTRARSRHLAARQPARAAALRAATGRQYDRLGRPTPRGAAGPHRTRPARMSAATLGRGGRHGIRPVADRSASSTANAMRYRRSTSPSSTPPRRSRTPSTSAKLSWCAIANPGPAPVEP